MASRRVACCGNASLMPPFLVLRKFCVEIEQANGPEYRVLKTAVGPLFKLLPN